MRVAQGEILFFISFLIWFANRTRFRRISALVQFLYIFLEIALKPRGDQTIRTIHGESNFINRIPGGVAVGTGVAVGIGAEKTKFILINLIIIPFNYLHCLNFVVDNR